MQENDVQPSGLTRRGVLGGMGIAGLALSFAGDCAEGACSLEFSIGGKGGTLPPSSSVIVASMDGL